MTLPQAKPYILTLQPYVGGEGHHADENYPPVRLASNENALGSSPLARQAYIDAAKDLFRYPDGGCAALRDALAKKHGLQTDRIVCGAGSDELISLITNTYAGNGDEIIHTKHAFLRYKQCAILAGAEPISAQENNLTADIDNILSVVTDKTKIVFLANPNNPTGSVLKRDAVERLCEELPSRILLVIDSAYAEFVTGSDYEDGCELVQKYSNVAMLRTFSKIYGLSALRLGWGYFSPDAADALNRIRGPFNVNQPVQAAAIAALEDTDFVQKTIEMTQKGYVQIVDGLNNLGISTHPSVGNFLLADFGETAEDIRRALRDRNIFIRQMGAYALPTHLRITIGTADENAILLSALQDILKS